VATATWHPIKQNLLSRSSPIHVEKATEAVRNNVPNFYGIDNIDPRLATKIGMQRKTEYAVLAF
jgi:hypothetical protein